MELFLPSEEFETKKRKIRSTADGEKKGRPVRRAPQVKSEPRLTHVEGVTKQAKVTTLEELLRHIRKPGEDGGLWGDEHAASVIAKYLNIKILLVNMDARKGTNPYLVHASSDSPSHAIVLILQK